MQPLFLIEFYLKGNEYISIGIIFKTHKVFSIKGPNVYVKLLYFDEQHAFDKRASENFFLRQMTRDKNCLYLKVTIEKSLRLFTFKSA